MSIIQGHAMQSSSRGFYPKTINGSLRFNSLDAAYLQWTPDGAGTSGTTFTISVWFKISNLTPAQDAYLFSAGSPSTSNELFYVLIENASNDLRIQWRDQGSSTTRVLQTSRLFRDPSAWYHLVISVDTNASEAVDRMKVYINGELETSFVTDARSTLNSSSSLAATAAVLHTIGAFSGNTSYLWDGYMAEFFFIDGTAHDADAFGETKNGVWVPKNITASSFTMGNNGFYLNFEDDAEVEAFNTVLYEGNGNTNYRISGAGFQPDFVWIKGRSFVSGHQQYDSVRGATKRLQSHSTGAEDTQATGLKSFDGDGFTVGSLSTSNTNNANLVAWCWKAGGAPTVDNSAGAGNVPTAGSVKIDGVNSTSALAGSIPAKRLSASTTYGFSIVKYDTIASATQTFGHGLSAAPDWVITKRLDSTSNWAVYHSSLGNDEYLFLNGTGGAVTDTTYWNNTAPSSSVVTLGNAFNASSERIAYCWTETTGVSKFGSYTGTGASGNAVTTGFKPALVIIKKDATASWYMFDNTRDAVNDATLGLFPDLTAAEVDSATYAIAFTDTGFTINGTNAGINTNTSTYIYAAFADTRSAAFWLDQSSNNNDWQPENLDYMDSLSDSPTDNYATMNAISGYGGTLSDGNLAIAMDAGSTRPSNFGMSSGKWYWEVTINSTNWSIGLTNGDDFSKRVQTDTETSLFDFGRGSSVNTGGKERASNSTKSYDNHTPNVSTGIYGFALDLDAANPKCDIYYNGTLAYTFDTFTIDGPYFFGIDRWNGSPTTSHNVNFGQLPFVYGPPS